MEARRCFGCQGYEMPIETNAAEYFLDLINTDVVREGDNLNLWIGISAKRGRAPMKLTPSKLTSR